ncbi:unnamed protein product [Allacma fusca]|uniref:Uncharacterized protein n=1 Tax=Allacma fusca TaxID=39272 RepID=A0A8J2K418_9HEXA|nr:unnamed protein product [Allacma fusca]
MIRRNSNEAENGEHDEDAVSLNDNKSQEESPNRNRFTGLILAAFSCVAFSLSALIVKYLKDYHPLSKSVWRFQGRVAGRTFFFYC